MSRNKKTISIPSITPSNTITGPLINGQWGRFTTTSTFASGGWYIGQPPNGIWINSNGTITIGGIESHIIVAPTEEMAQMVIMILRKWNIVLPYLGYNKTSIVGMLVTDERQEAIEFYNTYAYGDPLGTITTQLHHVLSTLIKKENQTPSFLEINDIINEQFKPVYEAELAIAAALENDDDK